MSFPGKLVTDKFRKMFEKLLVEAKSAGHYNNAMCVNYREQRSLCALLFYITKLCETSGQPNLTEGWRKANI